MTPLQKLKEYIHKIIPDYEKTQSHQDGFHDGLNVVLDRIEILLPEEKQMVIDAYNQDLYGGLSGNRKFETGEQYFNETFVKP
jgi:hypothetical protein